MDPGLKKFLDILKAIGPGILAATVPGAAPFIPLIINAIGAAQQMKGATGPEKKRHVMEIATASLTVANAGLKEDLEPAPFLAALSSGIDTTVGIVAIVEGRKKAVDAKAA